MMKVTSEMTSQYKKVQQSMLNEISNLHTKLD